MVPWRRKHPPKREWKGVGGRERDKCWSLHKRCRTKEMSELNLREKKIVA